MSKPEIAPTADHYSDWPTRDEAAARIGVSTKTITKLEKDRRLQRRNRRRPGQPPVAIYHPKDVERAAEYYSRMFQPGIIPFTGHHSNGAPKTAVPQRNPAAILEALLSGSSSSRVPIAQRVYLKLPEASEFSGLPENYLRQLIRAGKLSAITEGVRGWRIRREDLAEL
jgi:excisionase family DNA binding protein